MQIYFYCMLTKNNRITPSHISEYCTLLQNSPRCFVPTDIVTQTDIRIPAYFSIKNNKNVQSFSVDQFSKVIHSNVIINTMHTIMNNSTPLLIKYARGPSLIATKYI